MSSNCLIHFRKLKYFDLIFLYHRNESASEFLERPRNLINFVNNCIWCCKYRQKKCMKRIRIKIRWRNRKIRIKWFNWNESFPSISDCTESSKQYLKEQHYFLFFLAFLQIPNLPPIQGSIFGFINSSPSYFYSN